MRLQQPPIHLVVICFAFAANVHQSKTLRFSNDRNVRQDVSEVCPARELWPPYFTEKPRGRCDTTVFDIKLVRRKDESFENREHRRELQSKVNRCDLERNSKTGAVLAEYRSKTVDSRKTRLPIKTDIRHAQKDSRIETKERRDQTFLVRNSETSKRSEITGRSFENNLRRNDLTVTDSERALRNSGNRRRDDILRNDLRSENNRRQDSQRHRSLRSLVDEQSVESTTRREQRKIERSTIRREERRIDNRRQNQIQDRFRITTERSTLSKPSATDSRVNGDRKMQLDAQIRTDIRKIGRMNSQEIDRRIDISRLIENRNSDLKNSQQFERRTEKPRNEEIRNGDHRSSQRFEQRAYNYRTEENRMSDRRNGHSSKRRIDNSRTDKTRRVSNLRRGERIELQNREEISANERRIDSRTERRTNIVDLHERMMDSRRNTQRVEQRERTTRVDESKINERTAGQRRTESPKMGERRTSTRINDRRIEQRIDSERMEQRIRLIERKNVQRTERNPDYIIKLKESNVDTRRNDQRRDTTKRGDFKIDSQFDRQTNNGRMEGENEHIMLDQRRKGRFERGITVNSRSQGSFNLQLRSREREQVVSRASEERRSSRITTSRNAMPNRIVERRQLSLTNSINREVRLQSHHKSIQRKSRLMERRRSLGDSLDRDIRTQPSRSLEQRRRYLTDSLNRELRTDFTSAERQSRSLEEQQLSLSGSINREVRTQSRFRSLVQQRYLADSINRVVRAYSRTRSVDRQQSRSLDESPALLDNLDQDIRTRSGSGTIAWRSRYLTGSLRRELRTDFERRSRLLEQRRTLTGSLGREMRSRSVVWQTRSVARRRSLTDSMVREVRADRSWQSLSLEPIRFLTDDIDRKMPMQPSSNLIEQPSSSVERSMIETMNNDILTQYRSKSIERQSRSLERQRSLSDSMIREARLHPSRSTEREYRSVEQRHSLLHSVIREGRLQSRSRQMEQQSRSVEQRRSSTDSMIREVRLQSSSRSTERQSRSVEPQQRSLADTTNRDVRTQSRAGERRRSSTDSMIRELRLQSRSVEQQRSLADTTNRDVRTQSRSGERRRTSTDSTIREVRLPSRARSTERQSRSVEQRGSLKDSLPQKLSIAIELKSRSLRQERALRYSVNKDVRTQLVEKKSRSFEQRRSLKDATNSAVRQELTKSVQSKTPAQKGSLTYSKHSIKPSNTLAESTLHNASQTPMVSEKNSTDITENTHFIEDTQSERNILKRLALLYIRSVKTIFKIVPKYNAMVMKDLEHDNSNKDLEGIITFSSKKLTHFNENPEQVSIINGNNLRGGWPEPTMLPWTGAILGLTLTLLLGPNEKRIET